jgi:prepilin-type N-terminal cleavage/methylation domain-containing protein
MQTIRRRPFTLIEMMAVMSIIAILLGITTVAISLSRQRAKFVRWQAYNAMFNRDPEAVLNFNFMDMDFRQQPGKVSMPALSNGAIGCTVPGFEPKEYHGLINNARWVRGGGRSRHHHALQFDGSRSFVEIPGLKALDIDPEADDMTILMWVRFDTLSGTRVLCAKAEWTNAAQYDVYLNRSAIEVDAGSAAKAWKSPTLKAGEWYHVALVLENLGGSGGTVYNPAGKPVPGKSKDTRVVQAYVNGVPMGNEGAATAAAETTTERSFLLGGVWVKGSSLPRYLFHGRMDEFVLIRRALPAAEIANHYQTGKY